MIELMKDLEPCLKLIYFTEQVRILLEYGETKHEMLNSKLIRGKYGAFLSYVCIFQPSITLIRFKLWLSTNDHCEVL